MAKSDEQAMECSRTNMTPEQLEELLQTGKFKEPMLPIAMATAKLQESGRTVLAMVEGSRFATRAARRRRLSTEVTF